MNESDTALSGSAKQTIDADTARASGVAFRLRAALGGGSVLGLGLVYASSRAFGLFREVGVAYFFGTSPAADGWSAAFAVSSLAVVLASQGTYAAAVRWLGQQSTAAGIGESYARLLPGVWKLAAVTTVLYALVAPAACMLILGHDASLRRSFELSLALAPTVGASMLAACANAKLTLEGRFVLINASQGLYSFGAACGLGVIYVVGRTVGPEPVALGWSLGNVAALAVVYHFANPRLRLGRGASVLPDVVRIGVPIAVAYSLISVQGLTDQAVAGHLASGDVAAISYADRLFLIPVGFVLTALGPVLLGALTIAQRHGTDHVAQTAMGRFSRLSGVIAPCSVLFVGIAPYLVRYIYGYGAFAHTSSTTTIRALDGFSVGISAVAVSVLLFRAMQAVCPLRAVIVVTMLSVALNAVLSVTLAIPFGIYGDTLATSACALVTMQAQLVAVGRALGSDWAPQMRRSTTLPVICACASALVIVTLTHTGAVDRLGALVCSVAGAGVIAVASRRTGE